MNDSELAGFDQRVHRLDGLDDFERKSALMVATLIGACVEAHDIGGRQGAVDVLLRYSKRCAPLEIMSVGSREGREFDGLLSKCDWKWPLPGKHSWLVRLNKEVSLAELKKRYGAIICGLEEAGVDNTILLDPSLVPSIQDDLKWAAAHQVVFLGIESRPGWASDVFIERRETGGPVDHRLSGLAKAVEALLAEDNVRKHIEKLSRSMRREKCMEEAHLFVGVFDGGLPFAQEFAIAAWGMDHGMNDLPDCKPPRLPDGLARLWILVHGSSLLLEVSSEEWRWHPCDSVLGRVIP